MEITEVGKAMAASIEFAEQTRDFIVEWKQMGLCEERGKALVIAMIAVTLCASDDRAIPFKHLKERSGELKKFVDSHFDEINEASETLFANILLLDRTAGPIQ